MSRDNLVFPSELVEFPKELSYIRLFKGEHPINGPAASQNDRLHTQTIVSLNEGEHIATWITIAQLGHEYRSVRGEGLSVHRYRKFSLKNSNTFIKLLLGPVTFICGRDLDRVVISVAPIGGS